MTPRLAGAAVAVIAAGAALAAASTYRIYSPTADETQHVAAGLDWLAGSYSLWRDQRMPHLIVTPPLARVAVAIGPFIDGLRLTTVRELPYRGGGPRRNLALARAGVLPFLALVVILTWALGRRLVGDTAATWAALFVACVPAVVGHGALATTDVPAAATFLLSLLAFVRWLERPGLGRAAALGVAAGLAFATKFSAALLVPCALVLALGRRLSMGPPRAQPRVGARAAETALATAVAAVVVWASYRFSIGSPRAIAAPEVLDAMLSSCAPSATGRSILEWLADRQLPAPEVLDGVFALCAKNAPGGSTGYLLGRISQNGFAAFFPIALIVKTPLPLLALAGAGVWAAGRRQGEERWRALAPAYVAVTLFAVLAFTRINIGIRHALPVFPMLALLAGLALTWLWRSPRRPRLARAIATGLVVWAVVTPFAAAPDFFPWFNALAGRHPEKVLLDSDLDWGQDLYRLEAALAERHATHVSLAYFGPADLCREPLPPGRWLRPHQPTTGLIALSEMYRRGVVGFAYRGGDYCDHGSLDAEARPDPEQYAWLDSYEPIARIGRSILLYDIEDAATSTVGRDAKIGRDAGGN